MNKYIEFSRVKPPMTLVPVNFNAVGAHNELLPNTEYGSKEPQGTTCPYNPEPPKLIKRVKKSIVRQRQTTYDDPHKARETPLHPPYMSYESDSIQGKSIMNTGPSSF